MDRIEEKEKKIISHVNFIILSLVVVRAYYFLPQQVQQSVGGINPAKFMMI
jgi:hypothetical protein